MNKSNRNIVTQSIAENLIPQSSRISAYIQTAYALDINPITALRKRFPDYDWEEIFLTITLFGSERPDISVLEAFQASELRMGRKVSLVNRDDVYEVANSESFSRALRLLLRFQDAEIFMGKTIHSRIVAIPDDKDLARTRREQDSRRRQ